MRLTDLFENHRIKLLESYGNACKYVHDDVPPEIGTTPLPLGTKRYFHYTWQTPDIESICAQGLKTRSGLVWVGSDVDEYRNYLTSESDTYVANNIVVELAMNPNDPLIKPESPYQYNRVFKVYRDIQPTEIIAIHMPWHKKCEEMIQQYNLRSSPRNADQLRSLLANYSMYDSRNVESIINYLSSGKYLRESRTVKLFESASARIYHACLLYVAEKIVRDDKFILKASDDSEIKDESDEDHMPGPEKRAANTAGPNLNIKVDTKKYPWFLSCTPRPWQGYFVSKNLPDYNKGMVIFELDGNLMNTKSNYQIEIVHYNVTARRWKQDPKTQHLPIPTGYDEAEERVFSKTPSIKLRNNLIAVHVFGQGHDLTTLKSLCAASNIKLYEYPDLNSLLHVQTDKARQFNESIDSFKSMYDVIMEGHKSTPRGIFKKIAWLAAIWTGVSSLIYFSFNLVRILYAIETGEDLWQNVNQIVQDIEHSQEADIKQGMIQARKAQGLPINPNDEPPPIVVPNTNNTTIPDEAEPLDLPKQDIRAIRTTGDDIVEQNDEIANEIIWGNQNQIEIQTLFQGEIAKNLIVLAHEQGIKGRELVYLLAQLGTESHMDPTAVNQNSNFKYRARGLIQLDGIRMGNDGRAYDDPWVYQNMQQKLRQHFNINVDLVNNPDLASRPDISYRIAICYWLTNVRPRVNFESSDVRGTVLKITRIIAGDRKIHNKLQGEDRRIQLTQNIFRMTHLGEILIKHLTSVLKKGS